MPNARLCKAALESSLLGPVESLPQADKENITATDAAAIRGGDHSLANGIIKSLSLEEPFDAVHDDHMFRTGQVVNQDE